MYKEIVLTTFLVIVKEKQRKFECQHGEWIKNYI